MKIERQRLVNAKRSNTLEQIKKKNEVSLKLIDKSKLEKMERMLKMNTTNQKDDTIKNKMKNHFDKLEEERVEIEKLIELRSKKIIIFLIEIYLIFIFYSEQLQSK